MTICSKGQGGAGIFKAARSACFLMFTAFLLLASPGFPPAALAQGIAAGSGSLLADLPAAPIEAPRGAPSSTILPTDVVPLPQAQERTTFGENLQLRVLQRLPAPFYFNSTVEMSVRQETNVFQFPTKRKLIGETAALQAPIFRQLNGVAQAQLLNTLNQADAYDVVFRILPNITWGWALKPRTRVYGNYFMIRDELTHWTRLNTVIHSIGYGIQQDIPVGRRGNVQADIQFRELYQLHVKPKFDFLPGLTYSRVMTPRLVFFVNTLAQLRGKGYFRSPNVEIDPFYTWGGYYAKNGWAFSATTTFVQNFRQPFHHEAVIPINNYSFISDFEIARRFIRQLPGLQAFARAEPIWNFHSHAHPGLTGMDFRMFLGLRMQLGKPALTAAYEQIRQQLEEQETAPPPPSRPGEAKPSAYLMPYQLIADNRQPIHGAMENGLSAVICLNQVSAASRALINKVMEHSVTKGGDRAARSEALPRTAAGDSKAGGGLKRELAKRRKARSLPQRSVAARSEREASERSAYINTLIKKHDRRRELQMVLVPPLPAVDPDSTENPFAQSGFELKRPILNVIR